MKETLLVELGTEELPPRALPKLSLAFGESVEQGLRAAEFSFEAISLHATPRRLALSIEGLAAQQPDRVEQRRGPAVRAAFADDGSPTKAALGFARSCGVDVESLGRTSDGKGEWLSYEVRLSGRPIEEIAPELIDQALAALPVPKRMRWGAETSEFVRPVHWLVVLYGAEIVPCEVMGVKSGRTTRGHRFHHPAPLELRHADEYSRVLENPGHVVSGFAERRERVRRGVEQCARQCGGAAAISSALLDEVTALVEWPVAISGSFDEHFLDLPSEALIATMQDHQKYFPVTNEDGSLMNCFVTVSNIESREPDTVRHGNERVIRPRLADAGFFWKTDRARPLESRLEGLDAVLFESRLGSLRAKTDRIEALVSVIAHEFAAEPRDVARAARLSRCDLLSEMVGEFPELQGTMGRYYARADGEPEPVPEAIGEFYRPRFAGDALPATPAGQCLAVADKLDSLVGIFGIGAAPTGDKDPFALRRSAIGVVRILTEHGIELNLRDAIDASIETYSGIKLERDTAGRVFDFARERMRGYYLEQGIPPDVCDAVFANDPPTPPDISRRLDAVVRFRRLEAAGALAAANKRIANILKKLDSATPATVDRALLVEPAEKELMACYDRIAPAAADLFGQGEYAAYMELLANLRDPVDTFFDDVMVMCEDGRLRENRISLLTTLHALFTRVADIARLN